MKLNPSQKEYHYNTSKEYKGLNQNGKMQFKIEEIISKCESINDMEFVCFITSILNEPRQDLIIELYKELGKEFIIAILEKTLRIENEGGILQKTSSEIKEKKSLGGIFFYLMKINDGSVEVIKRITKINYHKRNERKKIYRKLEKMSI